MFRIAGRWPGSDHLHRGYRGPARARVAGPTFDGYKAHLGVDPDDELITNVAVTPANTADRDVIEDLLDEPERPARPMRRSSCGAAAEPGDDDGSEGGGSDAAARRGSVGRLCDGVRRFGLRRRGDPGRAGRRTGTTCARRCRRCATPRLLQGPVQHRPRRRDGRLPGPAYRRRSGRPRWRRQARFGALWCSRLPAARGLHDRTVGRVIGIHPHEAATATAPRPRQRDRTGSRSTGPPARSWNARSATSARRAWGGRKARCRGHTRILTDVLDPSQRINLARLATLGLHHGPTGWAIA